MKTGKCIHTDGGWPGEDKKMVLWSLCDETRLEIWFVKQGNSLLVNSMFNFLDMYIIHKNPKCVKAFTVIIFLMLNFVLHFQRRANTITLETKPFTFFAQGVPPRIALAFKEPATY